MSDSRIRRFEDVSWHVPVSKREDIDWDHAEIFLVIEGDCSFNGESMNARDCTVVEAGQDYSFKAGPQGVTFLVTRQGAASYQEA
jgi:hypothetical protein